MLQPREAAIIVVAGAADGHAEPFGDVTQRQVLETGQFERRALPRRQLGEPGAQDPATFLLREPRAAIGDAFVEHFNLLASIRRPSSKRGLPAERPVIDVLQQPDAKGSALRGVEMGLAVDLEEDFLRDVFGFAAVVQDPVGDPRDQTNITLKQIVEGVRLMGADVAKQLGVGPFAVWRALTVNRC
jgi:hypothetical protein